jgi:lactose/L-arabinose transport system substrate-binding protein
MKKKIACFLLLCILLGLTACKKEVNVSEQVISNDTLEGKVLVWTSASEQGIVEDYINKFKQEHNKVVVENVYINQEELESKLKSALEYPDNKPDIMILSEASINIIKKYYSAFGEFSETLDRPKSQMLKDKASFISSNGKFLAVPWYIAPTVMFYRRDIFQDAGINVENIKTWNDYMEVGKKLLEKTEGKVKLLPFDVTKDSNLFRRMLNQLGGSYYDKEGKLQLSSLAAMKSMLTIKGLYEQNLCYDASSVDEVIAAAQNDEIATIPFSTEIISGFKEKLTEQSSKWGVMYMPAFEAGGGTASIAKTTYMVISKDISHYEAASAFKDFLQNNKEIEEEYITKKGLFPFVSELYEQSFVDEGDIYFNNQKIWRYILEIIKEAPEFIIGEDFNKVSPEIIKAQNNIFIEKQDIKTALEAAFKKQQDISKQQ